MRSRSAYGPTRTGSLFRRSYDKRRKASTGPLSSGSGGRDELRSAPVQDGVGQPKGQIQEQIRLVWAEERHRTRLVPEQLRSAIGVEVVCTPRDDIAEPLSIEWKQ